MILSSDQYKGNLCSAKVGQIMGTLRKKIQDLKKTELTLRRHTEQLRIDLNNERKKNKTLRNDNEKFRKENDLFLADYDKMQVICRDLMIEGHQKDQELELLRQQVRDLKSLNAGHNR